MRARGVDLFSDSKASNVGNDIRSRERCPDAVQQSNYPFISYETGDERFGEHDHVIRTERLGGTDESKGRSAT